MFRRYEEKLLTRL